MFEYFFREEEYHGGGRQQKGKVLEASRQANGKTDRIKICGLLRNKVESIA